MNAGVAPSRIERQLKKLNDYGSDCVCSLNTGVLASAEEDKFDGRISERVR